MNPMSQSTVFRLNTEAAFSGGTVTQTKELPPIVLDGVPIYQVSLHVVYTEGTSPGLEKYQKKEVTIRNLLNGTSPSKPSPCPNFMS